MVDGPHSSSKSVSCYHGQEKHTNSDAPGEGAPILRIGSEASAVSGCL